LPISHSKPIHEFGYGVRIARARSVRLPAENNWIENQIRSVAVGRLNWLFAGGLRAGQRAAVIISLIQSARLNGHDPYAYLKDVFTRLPTQPMS
ncbi:transposase domain-containing protein, partial [Variovorax sp. LG9.2]